MASVGLESILILLMIVANGVFAMAEISVVSARRARLQQRAEEGDAGARAALDLVAQPTRFLSTVQIGITLIGTLAGAFGGATIAKELANALRNIPALAPSADALALILVVVGVAYLSLVIGELVPKRLALNNAERTAAALARPMRALSRIAAPVVSLLTASTELATRLLGMRPSGEPPVTEDEVRMMLAQGAEAGVFEEAEQDIVENVFRLADRRISALMTPRTETIWLDLDDPPEANWRKITGSGYSTFPVYRGGVDNVQGMADVTRLWAQVMAGQPLDLQAALQPPLFVPENLAALKALDAFKAAGVQEALVIDEYGGVQGLVTLFDVLEAIVGDLSSREAQENPQAVQREDGSWLLDGLLPLDEFRALFQLKSEPDDDRDYQTLGGLVMEQLGRIPEVADHFEWRGLRFEVMDMDRHRVDKVLVMPEEPLGTEPYDRI